MLKAIIVDDEELAIERLNDLLLENGEVEILKSFLEPEEALNFIMEQNIDVAFLDIDLPGMNGLMLANLIINTDSNIEVVFVTGYDEYAVKAFELNAIDYLMKPVTKERLGKTIEKLTKNKNKYSANVEAKVSCFGGFDIYTYNKPQKVKWRTSKAEELLAFLIHNEGKIVSRDYLVDNLWKEIEPLKAMNNLNATTYYLRKALNNIGIKECIITSKSDIWIEAGKLSSDLYEFARILRENTLVNNSSIRVIENAISLYVGDYLMNRDYLWADPKRILLKKGYIEMLTKASEYYFNEGMTTSAVASLKRILTLEPLQEKIHEKLLKLYILTDNRSEAEKQYELLNILLDEDLGVEPSNEIKRLRDISRNIQFKDMVNRYIFFLYFYR